MIAALYVLPSGPYANLPDIDLWDESRDARLYSGPYKVVAHPPCERWGRYWSGGPSAKTKRKLGDDNGCFRRALSAVRVYGGILEHPEASHAWEAFGLERPLRSGGWTEPDKFGGRSCCVAQGHYGHRAQKLTWLYGVNIEFKDLIWGPCKGKARLDMGFHSSLERSKSTKLNLKRLTPKENNETPLPFRNLLLSMVR